MSGVSGRRHFGSVSRQAGLGVQDGSGHHGKRFIADSQIKVGTPFSHLMQESGIGEQVGFGVGRQ